MTLLYNPRQMVFVSCRGRVGLMNTFTEREYIVATTWHSPVSREPPLYLVMISKARQEALHAIIDEGTFVINFMPSQYAEAAIKLSDHRTAFENPYVAAKLTPAQSQSAGCRRIAEAAGWAECELWKHIEAGDHTIVIGRVIHTELPMPNAKRLFHVDADKFTTTE